MPDLHNFLLSDFFYKKSILFVYKKQLWYTIFFDEDLRLGEDLILIHR